MEWWKNFRVTQVYHLKLAVFVFCVTFLFCWQNIIFLSTIPVLHNPPFENQKRLHYMSQKTEGQTMKFPKGQTMILYKYTTQKNGLSNTNPTNFGVNSCASERQAVPAPLGPPFVLLFLQMLCYFLFVLCIWLIFQSSSLRWPDFFFLE